MKRIVVLYQHNTLGILLDDLFKITDYGVFEKSKALHVTKDINTQREVMRKLQNSYCDTRYVTAGKTRPSIEVVTFQDVRDQLVVGLERDAASSAISKSYLDLLSDYKTIVVQDIEELLMQDDIIPFLQHLLQDANDKEQSIVFTTKANPYMVKNIIAILSGDRDIEIIDNYYNDVLDNLYKQELLKTSEMQQLIDVAKENNNPDISAENRSRFNEMYNQFYANSCFICAPQSAQTYLSKLSELINRYHKEHKSIRSKEIDRILRIVQDSISDQEIVNTFVRYITLPSYRSKLEEGMIIHKNRAEYSQEELEILQTLLKVRIGRLNLVDTFVSAWDFFFDVIGEENIASFLSRFDHVYIQDLFYRNQLIPTDKLLHILNELKSLKPSIDIRFTNFDNDSAFQQKISEIMQVLKDTSNLYTTYSCAVSVPYIKTLLENKTPIEKAILKQQLVQTLEHNYNTLMQHIVSGTANRVENIRGDKASFINSFVASLIAIQAVDAYLSGKDSMNLIDAVKQSSITSGPSFMKRYNITWDRNQIEFLNTMYNENMSLMENIQIASAVIGKNQNQYIINPYMLSEDVLYKFQTYVQTYDLPCTFTSLPASMKTTPELGVGNLER